MAYIDPDQSQCKTVFRKGTYVKSETATGYFQGKRVKVNLTDDAYKQSGFFWCDWHYHCPGDTHPGDPDSIYTLGDNVLIECDEEDTPIRVVGFTDGAQTCATFCIAYMDYPILHVYHNEVHWSHDVKASLNAAYIERGEKTVAPFFVTVRVDFAEDYPYRIAVSIRLSRTPAYYPFGAYASVIYKLEIKEDGDYDLIEEGVYFYSYFAPNEAHPTSANIPNCEGEAISAGWGVDRIVTCPDMDLVAEPCIGERPIISCTTTYGDPRPCHSDLDVCVSEGDCGTLPTLLTNVGFHECVGCVAGSALLGVYMTESSIPEMIIMNPVYIAAISSGWILTGDSKEVEYDCVYDGEYWEITNIRCGAIILDVYYADKAYNIFPSLNSVYETDDLYNFPFGFKIYYKEVTDPDISGEFDLGIEDYNIAFKDMFAGSSSFILNEDSTGADIIDDYARVRQQSCNTLGYHEFFWGVQREVETCLNAWTTNPDCTYEIISTELQFHGRTLSLPSNLSHFGHWECIQKIQTSGEPIFSLRWWYSGGFPILSVCHTNHLGQNLKLVTGLPSPLNQPNTTLILVMPSGAGFIISSIGRVYAYSNFILVDIDKIKPVGDYLYYWNLDLNVTSLATAAAFYVLAA